MRIPDQRWAVPGSAEARPAGLRRFGELDAIRGIAALIVVFQHCLIVGTPVGFHVRGGSPWHRLATEPRYWLELPPLRLLFAGHAAVAVFFVLSGFVLALPILTKRQPTYFRYLVKRFFRIYVPFAAAILLAALACFLLQPTPIQGLNPWINESWKSPVTGSLILRHLDLSGRDTSLDTPMWSLVHEARISIIFPLLAIIVINTPRVALICSCLATILLTFFRPIALLNELVSPDVAALVSSLEDTLSLALYFVLGIVIAAKHHSIALKVKRMPVGIKGSLWILSLLLLEIPSALPHYNLLYYPAGAALLIALAIGSPKLQQVLDRSPFFWLGRISYSLYLTHMIVLLLAVHLLYGKMPLLLLLILVVALALAAADIMCRIIEIPAQRIGQFLANKKTHLGFKQITPEK